MSQPAPAETLLVFDLDNTLVHSRIDFRSIRTAIIDMLRQAGATSLSDEGLFRHAIPELIGFAERHDGAHGTAMAAEMWRVVLHYETLGMAVATIEHGAADVLARLQRRGHPLSVLTNNARPATLEALDKFALRRYFDLVVTRDDVAQMKPASDGVHRAIEVFKARTRRTLVIGDSWIDAAAAAGAGAGFLAFQPRPNDLETRGFRPLAVVQRLDELEALDLAALAQPTA
jgi:phosphoglycolate phosphatase